MGIKLFIIIGFVLVLVGCSLNDKSSSSPDLQADLSSDEDQLSSSDLVQLSSSCAVQMSSSSEVQVSSSTKILEVDTEFRNLNVVVNYQQDSAWEISASRGECVTGMFHGGYCQTLWTSIDTVLLWKVRGDTLEFSSIRRFYGSGVSEVKLIQFECYLTQSSCSFEDGFTENPGPYLFYSISVGNAQSPKVLWDLAASDSAVIWDDSWGMPPSKYPGGDPAQTHFNVNGVVVDLKVIPRPAQQDRAELPIDSARLFLIADYNRDSVWVRTENVVTGTFSNNSCDTIEVLERSKDSLILFVHGVSTNVVGSTSQTTKKKVQYLKEGVIIRASENPLVMEISEPMAENREWFLNLASQDTAIIWSDDFGMTSLHTEHTIDYHFTGFTELGLNTKDYLFGQNGLECLEAEAPMPLFGGFYKKTVTLKPLRE